jgi:hypothetical protein
MNEALAMAVTQAPRPIASVLPDVHPLVAEVVDRALAYNPQDRYADARMMQEAVQTAYSALDETATPLSAELPPLASGPGAAPTPASIDVPIEIEATPPPDAVAEPPLKAPNTLLASAPAVTAGARGQKAANRRSLFRLVAATAVVLVAAAGAALLFVIRTPAPEVLATSAGKSEDLPVPQVATAPLVNAGQPVATLALPDSLQTEQPAPKVAPPTPEPRAKAAKPARMKTQAPSSERPPPAPAKSSDPYAKRR